MTGDNVDAEEERRALSFSDLPIDALLGGEIPASPHLDDGRQR